MDRRIPLDSCDHPDISCFKCSFSHECTRYGIKEQIMKKVQIFDATLYLAGIRDTKEANALPADTLKFCIVRGKTPPGMENWIHVPDLAPSADLVFGFFKKSAQDADAWEEYKRRWAIEKDTEEYRDAVWMIFDCLERGTSVVLGCWCTNDYCHRYLVADELQRLENYVADEKEPPMADDPVFDRDYDDFDESLLAEE
jgi:hypothetical protein